MNAAKKRADGKVKKSVREQCVERDGRCALRDWAYLIGFCDGPAEHAHAVQRRQARTVNMPSTYRHMREHSFMACRFHHRAYDAHKFAIVYADALLGMDGRWSVELR